MFYPLGKKKQKNLVYVWGLILAFQIGASLNGAEIYWPK